MNTMQRSYAILIGGFTMLILGNLIGNAILNLVITFNPNQSSLIKDTNYHLVWWSNSFLFISKLGILVLLLGGLVFFIDWKKIKKIQNS